MRSSVRLRRSTPLHQRAYRVHFHDPRSSTKFCLLLLHTAFKQFTPCPKAVSALISIRKPMLEQFPVPVPDKERQERIVAILDKFDALVNDLSIGLPAERYTRRQQTRTTATGCSRSRRRQGEARPTSRRRLATSRSPSATRAPSSPSSCPRAWRGRLRTERSRPLPAHHERVRADREPAHAARGAERDHVLRRRVGALLHAEDRRRQRGHRREDGAHPGGPRPGSRSATTAPSRTST